MEGDLYITYTIHSSCSFLHKSSWSIHVIYIILDWDTRKTWCIRLAEIYPFSVLWQLNLCGIRANLSKLDNQSRSWVWFSLTKLLKEKKLILKYKRELGKMYIFCTFWGRFFFLNIWRICFLLVSQLCIGNMKRTLILKFGTFPSYRLYMHVLASNF